MLSGPALGDDAKVSLLKFGLIGIWSPDCSKSSPQRRALRLTFAAPSEGGATATAEEARDDAVVTIVYDIPEATILADDKIRIAFRVATVTSSDGKATSQTDHDNMDVVFQKAGERIQLTVIQFEGLPEVERAILYGKCPTATK